MSLKLKELVGVLLEVGRKTQPIYGEGGREALPAEKSPPVIDVYQEGSIGLKQLLDVETFTPAALKELASRESEIKSARQPRVLLEAYEHYFNTLAEQVLANFHGNYGFIKVSAFVMGISPQMLQRLKLHFPLGVPRGLHDFGEGPVSAHRHRNPDGCIGGWAADSAEVVSTAFIGSNARVYGEARVLDQAQVYDLARVYGEAVIANRAKVYGQAQIRRNGYVSGDAQVYEKADIESGSVWHSARVFGQAKIGAYGYVQQNAQVYGNAKVLGCEDDAAPTAAHGTVCDNAKVFENAVVDCGEVSGNSSVYGGAHVLYLGRVCGTACVGGNVIVGGNWKPHATFYYEILDSGIHEAGDSLSASAMRRQMESLTGVPVDSAASPEVPQCVFPDGQGPVPAHRHHNPDGSIGGWVAETAEVARTAHVDENSKVFGHAKVYGHAKIESSSRIFDNARVFDRATVRGDSEVSGNAQVYEQAMISGGAKIGGGAKIFGEARVSGGAEVSGDAAVFGTSNVYGTVYLLTGKFDRSVFVPHQFGTD